MLSWKRAVCLLLSKKVQLLADYGDRRVRSQTLAVQWPAVVSLTRYVRVLHRVRLTRHNVLARDRWQCQYCRVACGPDLTLDHVVPRRQSRRGKVRLPWSGAVVPVHSWLNVTTACERCNVRKGDRTPEEARMPLPDLPRPPTRAEATRILFARIDIPHEWRDFLPRGID